MARKSFLKVEGLPAGLPSQESGTDHIQLVKKAREGDSDAFGALYDLYNQRIYRFVLLRVSHREDAEDLSHHVFLSAWEKIGAYEERGAPFVSWLYKIARNGVIDYYRTRKDEVSLDAVDPDLFIGQHYPEASASHAMELSRVYKELDALKPEYKDVVIMRFIDELSIKETADALEKSEGAVKLLQHRAIKELKKRLEGDASQVA